MQSPWKVDHLTDKTVLFLYNLQSSQNYIYVEYNILRLFAARNQYESIQAINHLDILIPIPVFVRVWQLRLLAIDKNQGSPQNIRASHQGSLPFPPMG